MKGGRHIGTGSDGCVFNVQFDESGNVVPGSENGGTGIASKVYVSGINKTVNLQAVNEYDIMMKVRKATNGLGVAVALDNTLRKIPDISPSERATIPADDDGACANLTDATKPYTVIELPLVKGHMIPAAGAYQPEEFSSLETAIAKLREAKLTQLDLASRNVFYDVDAMGNLKLILGDFGNGIDLSSDDPVKIRNGLIRFVKHYRAHPHTLIYRDGVHYRGYLYSIATVFCFIASAKAGDAALGAWKRVKTSFAEFKDTYRSTIKDWRISMLIDFFAPDVGEITDEDTQNILKELEALPEAPPDVVPAVASAPASARSENAVLHGTAPVGIEDAGIPVENYLAKRKEFLDAWMNGIDATCDEIIALGDDPAALLDMLTMKAKEGMLQSDELMYELVRAIYVTGSINDRLDRLIKKWFPPAAAVGGARKRTYRRKRVKMSRRR